MTDEQYKKGVWRRLDVLISLQLDAVPAETKVSMASKVQRLTDMGLTPSEVGSVIGRPTNFVTAVLATRKKALRKASPNA